MSASPAVVAAVRQAMTEHLADFDIEVAAQRCRCGLVVGQSAEAEAHRVEMVAAAAEAAALEAAAEAASYDHRTALFSGGVPTAPGTWGRVAVWLRKRAETGRSS